MMNYNGGDYVMPEWSKYHGESIDNVPRSYLEFLLEQKWIEETRHQELCQAIEDQLAIRDRSHITF